MIRTLSYTEIGQATTCEAAWDFGYGGRLAGSTLRPKHILPILSDGRAWGAAVAAWHASGGTLLAEFDAMTALRASLDQDFERMQKAGIVLDGFLDTRIDMEARLAEVFHDYMQRTQPLTNLTRLEGEILVPIPSRSGVRASSRYRFLCFLDGFTIDEHGNEWLVEFKLRNKLSSRAVIELGRQYLWYAWARRRELREQGIDRQVVGVIVDERLNDAPKGARIVNAKRKDQGIAGKTVSHATDQVTTVDRYLQACIEFSEDPNPDVIEALKRRIFQTVHRIPFRPSELDEAGQELVSAAKLVRDLDSGERYPIRNAQARLCNGCKFQRICKNPRDDLFVDQLFTRTIPKRLRVKDDVLAEGSTPLHLEPSAPFDDEQSTTPDLEEVPF